MTWLGKKRVFWDLGNKIPFRPSKERSQRFLEALVRCDGKIHSQFSLDVVGSEIKYNMKVHEIAVTFRISLPEGAETLFEEIVGVGLTPPPEIHFN